jgi:cell division protein FtsA
MSEGSIIGLDIGSSMIRIAVAQPLPGEDGKPRLHIIGAVALPSSGVHKGTVSSMEEAVSSVSKALERAERMTGLPLNAAWVSIAGQNILVQETRGVIGVTRPDGEIKDDDVERVMEAAKTITTPSNYEILHVIPKSFTVDGQRGVKDPVGMNGIRLEVDAVIIQALASHIKNLTKSIYRTGLDIDDLVYAPLATAEAVLTQRQKELGVCVVNIGASSTSIAVFEEGDLMHTAVLPIGGDRITSDIGTILRIPPEIAEKVKIDFGHAVPDAVDRKHTFSLHELGADVDEVVKRRFIAEIIESRVEELFEAVDAELRKVDRSGMLPVGVILTGGGAKLEGVVDVARRVLRLPCAMGIPVTISSVIDEVHDPAFATAIGLAVWGYAIKGMHSSKFGKFFSKFKSVDQVASKIGQWFKSMVP